MTVLAATPCYRLRVLLDGPAVRAWYWADVSPGGVLESLTMQGDGAGDPVALAVLEAAGDGARDAARAMERALQLHLPGVQ